MLRAVSVVLLCASSVAAADDAEDPRAAMKDRGIVLAAGKKHFLVLVPLAQQDPQTPADAKLKNASAYFGNGTRVSQVPTWSWMHRDTDVEELGLQDSWRLVDGEVHRRENTWTLHCKASFDKKKDRTVTLTPVDETTARRVITKAAVMPVADQYESYMLARMPAPASTTYVYVDHRGVGTDYRLFIGKRGAMKRVAVTELADDHENLILVTAKGTLMITKSETVGATFGDAKSPATLSLLSPTKNRELIYRDLGVYTREANGHPCYEL